MDAMFNLAGQYPIYGFIAAAIAALLVFAAAKRVLELALIAALALVAYVFFMHFQGKDLPSSAPSAAAIADQLREGRVRAEGVLSDVRDYVRDRVVEPIRAATGPDGSDPAGAAENDRTSLAK